MGKLKGHRMVTMYVNDELYEKVRCAAYILDELIYQFVDKALSSALDLRLDKAKRKVVDALVKQGAGKGRKRRSHHNPAL